MFLHVKGAKHGVIKGESNDASGHKGEIEVLSWSWGMKGKVTLGGGTGTPTGQTTIRELIVVKPVDRASTALMGALRTNETISKAVLTLRKAGKSQLEYLKITIEEGRVVGLDIEAGDRSGSAALYETVTFSFNKISVVYTPQGEDGQAQGDTTFEDEWQAK